ncbi:MAG TPA: helix-turn-helix domain-containing protein [Sphingomonas sp.]|nr:helix-turn-helix domain-containing protein [Sphingomonas sp.]
MVTLRDDVRAERRAAILEQATAIVGEHGYNGFGIQELAQRCGLTKAGLLHHFPSKEQLLIAVLRERDRQDEIAVAAFPGVVEPGHGGDPAALSTILTSLRAIVSRNATRPEFVRLYAMLRAEALHPDHPAHAWFCNREAATLEMFTQMVARHVDRPRSVARQVIALMSGLELQWLRDGQRFDLVAEWDLGIAALLPLPSARNAQR